MTNPNTIRPRLAITALAIVGALAATAAAAADTVTLRPSVRVAHAATVTLGDIATLDGAEARGLAALAFGVADAGAFEVSAERVRQAIVAAGGDPSVIRVHGDGTVVRPARGRPAVAGGSRVEQAAGAPTDASVSTGLGGAIAVSATPDLRLVDPNALASSATPLGLVASHLVGAFGDDAPALRLSIRADDLARLAGRAGLRYEIAPRSALRSDRVDFEIIAYDAHAGVGSRPVSRERVRVEPRLEREVAIATCDARRGDSLGAANLRLERRFLAPSLAARAAGGDAMGTELARTVTEGSVIESNDLARTLAVRRNDRVLIRREIGLVAIEIEAVALEDGVAGDLVAFETTGNARRRDARPVTAEVVGRGRAVIR
ncbi:MAG: Chaperone for flagella basal body P-ring formation [Planctomycetota bacterium]